MATKPSSQATTEKLKPLNKSELTCSVCLEQFKDPKVLPCCHTFCKQCLQPLVENPQEPTKAAKSQAQANSEGSAALSCPKCRTKHEIPEGGVDGFLTDYSLAHDLEVAAVVKTKEKKPSCGQCESGDPSVAYCVECEAFLCEFCSSAHKRMKSYREHNVSSLSKISSDSFKPSVKPLKCSQHPREDSSLYCKTCQQLICRDCTLVEHHSHDFHFANEVRQGFEAELVELARASMKKLVIYGKELQEIQKAEKFLQSESDTVKKQITAAFDTYISTLQSRRQTLLAEVDGEYQADSKKIWAHKEFTETAVADLTASLHFAERAHKCSSDTEMISLSKQAIQRLDFLNEKEHKLNDTYQVVDKTASYSCSRFEQQLLTCGSVEVTRSSSLKLSAVYGKTEIGGKVMFTVNFTSTTYQKFNCEGNPSVNITYGHSKKPFNEFVATKTGRSTWTVTMECICGGDHTISTSFLGYLANPMTITVSGVPCNGARVRPGPDWKGKIEDGEKGTVTQPRVDTSCQEVYVKWDNGESGGPYRWGKSSGDSTQQYQVELVPSFNIDLNLASTNFSFSIA